MRGRLAWKFISEGINVFLTPVSNEVGDGNRFRFWGAKWVGSQSPRSAFPRPFILSGSQTCSVAKFVSRLLQILDWIGISIFEGF